MRPMRLASLALVFLTLGGCAVLEQGHPYTESYPYNEAQQAYWRDKAWRDEKADFWASEYERGRQVRMQEFFRGN